MFEFALIWVKIVGAMIGSSVAVIFQPNGDTRWKRIQRFVLGSICGTISAPIIRDLIGWPDHFDYWLASAALGGLFGYLFLQVALSKQVIDRVKAKLGEKQ